MWLKYFIVVVIFYFFALLQNSFFIHFNFLGATPNLVFIFFTVLLFFSALSWENFFYAATGGLFLDFFSHTYFGISIIFLLAVGFLFKKIQSLLKENRGDSFPLVYFLPLFFMSFIAYDLLLRSAGFRIGLLAEMAYNLLFAVIIFYIYKRFFQLKTDNRQLKLFSG
jgi:rod shape-determining protein MreD